MRRFRVYYEAWEHFDVYAEDVDEATALGDKLARADSGSLTHRLTRPIGEITREIEPQCEEN